MVVKRGHMVSEGYLKAWADERNVVDVKRRSIVPEAVGLKRRSVPVAYTLCEGGLEKGAPTFARFAPPPKRTLIP